MPADVPLRLELVDEDGRMQVQETAFNHVRPGEVNGCVGCHERRDQTPPNLRPEALNHLPSPIRQGKGDLIYMGRRARPYNPVDRD